MSTDFPKRLAEKLRAIREQSGLSDDQFALQVKARDRAAIALYENGQEDLPVSVLFAYASIAGVPVEEIIDDDRALSFKRY